VPKRTSETLARCYLLVLGLQQDRDPGTQHAGRRLHLLLAPFASSMIQQVAQWLFVRTAAVLTKGQPGRRPMSACSAALALGGGGTAQRIAMDPIVE
jgi:hypothetical protein